MSDNKTPISLCIEALEKQKLENSKVFPDHVSGFNEGIETAIHILKSHLALEEEAIKEAYDSGVEIHNPSYKNSDEYYKSKFKPE